MSSKGKSLLLVLLTVLLLVATGCSAGLYKSAPQAPAMSDSAPRSGTTESWAEEAGVERKVILSGYLSVHVQAMSVARERLLDIVASKGGYVQSSSFYNWSAEGHWEFTLRIPSEVFDSAVAELGALGRVRQQSTSSQDVTEEYIDLDARLRVLNQEEDRLLDLLKLAVTIDDYLRVEAQLSRVRTEIEQTTGRLRYLANRIDFASLTVQILPEVGTVEPELKGFGGLGRRISNAFRDGVNLLVDLVAGLAIFIARALPVLPIVLLLLYLVYRVGRFIRVRRRKT